MGMLQILSDKNTRNKYFKKSPFVLIGNLFKKRKYHEEISADTPEMNQNEQYPASSQFEYDQAPRVSSSLSVSTLDIVMQTPCSPAMSTLTLTPGRTRDIDQDMQALRLSRQDNPFLQVLASRESLVDSIEESESDDANLMSQEFPSESDVDPLTLPEIHEHMIRSPPPITWPKSPNFKIFRFPMQNNEMDSSQESLPVSHGYSPRHSQSNEAVNKKSPTHKNSKDCGFGNSVLPSSQSSRDPWSQPRS